MSPQPTSLAEASTRLEIFVNWVALIMLLALGIVATPSPAAGSSTAGHSQPGCARAQARPAEASAAARGCAFEAKLR